MLKIHFVHRTNTPKADVTRSDPISNHKRQKKSQILFFKKGGSKDAKIQGHKNASIVRPDAAMAGLTWVFRPIFSVQYRNRSTASEHALLVRPKNAWGAQKTQKCFGVFVLFRFFLVLATGKSKVLRVFMHPVVLGQILFLGFVCVAKERARLDSALPIRGLMEKQTKRHPIQKI